jgi:hypothetical protein
MKCPNCGTESSGRFCPTCGASLRASKCASCGANLVPGARFCTRCGAEAGAAAGTVRPVGHEGGDAEAGSGSTNLPWYIAGAVLTALIIILVLPMIRDDGSGDAVRTPLGGVGGIPGAVAPGTPPPLTGTPREQADRLFNRIMAAREAGDMASAQMFVPMATQAYLSAQPLDDDGLYHLALVHIVGGSYDAARATAEQTLARSPNHLLALAAAGEAAAESGDSAAARDYYARFLDAYDSEIARALPEYQDHAGIFPEYQAAARRATGR